MKQRHRAWALALATACTVLALSGPAARGQPKKLDLLKIGTSGTLTADGGDKKKEEGALETLRGFIKEETMLTNEIARQSDWGELAQKMAKGDLHIGVFQGYEFAWAQEKYPDLKPLALAINFHRYPVACFVVHKDKGAKDFAGLAGQTLVIPATGQRFLQMFAEHLSQAGGKTADKYFAKIGSQENIEDALDDVVDGVVQAALVDLAALEAFKRRKPGRFNQLKVTVRSQPLPPVVLASYGKVLSEDTLKTFRDGILGANQKEKGQTILTLFRLSGFETVPGDFAKVLADTRKTYPAPGKS